MGSSFSHEQYCNVGTAGPGLCPIQKPNPSDPVMIPASYRAGQDSQDTFDSAVYRYGWEGPVSSLHF